METNNTKKKTVGIQYNQRFKHIGYTEIGLGSSAILLGTINIAVTVAIPSRRYYYFYASLVGAGVWCGAVVLVTGILGLLSSRKSTLLLNNGSMVASILTCIACVPMIVLEVVGVGGTPHYSRKCSDLMVSRHDYYYSYHRQQPTPPPEDADGLVIQCYKMYQAVQALHVLLAIIAVASFFSGLIHSVLCCSSVCCGRYKQSQAVHYFKALPSGQTSVVNTDGPSDNNQTETTDAIQNEANGQSLSSSLNAETPPPYAYARLREEMKAEEKPALMDV